MLCLLFNAAFALPAPSQFVIHNPVRFDGAATDSVIRTSNVSGVPAVTVGPGAPFDLVAGPSSVDPEVLLWESPTGWAAGETYTVAFGDASVTFAAGSVAASPMDSTVQVNRVEDWVEESTWQQRELSLDLVVLGDSWGWTVVSGEPTALNPHVQFTLDGPFDGLRTVVQRYFEEEHEIPCFFVTSYSAAGAAGTPIEVCELGTPDGDEPMLTPDPQSPAPEPADGGCSTSGGGFVLFPLAWLLARQRVRSGLPK